MRNGRNLLRINNGRCGLGDTTRLEERATARNAVAAFYVALQHAWRGLVVVFQREANFRIELGLGVLAVLVAWFVRVPVWPVVLVSVVVLSAEVVNSALERTVDLITQEQNPLARDIKDIAAGAVLLTSLGALVFAFVYLLPPLIVRIGVQ